MIKETTLNEIFSTLRSGEIPEKAILDLSNQLEESDVDWMLALVEKLTGPDQYFSADIEISRAADIEAEVIVKGFFLFIDLVSGLIIRLGEPAISRAQRFDTGNSKYIPWVLRYCSDSRFQSDIKDNFPFLGL